MLLQLLLTGVVFGLKYALVAVSFGIIFKVTQTFHFAHAVVYVAGAYTTLILFEHLNISLPVACVGGVAAATVFGWAIERLLYKPLRRINTLHEGILIASLGFTIITEMLIVLFIGDGPQSVGYMPSVITLGSVSSTSIQVFASVASAILIGALLWFLQAARHGRIMEAVALNPELSGLVGIKVDRVFDLAFLIGSALAGLGGVLALLDRGIDPFAGTMPATIAFIAVIMGGVNSILGGAISAFILGLVVNLSVLVIPPEWQLTAAFATVILVILVKPYGLFGTKDR